MRTEFMKELCSKLLLCLHGSDVAVTLFGLIKQLTKAEQVSCFKFMEKGKVLRCLQGSDESCREDLGLESAHLASEVARSRKTLQIDDTHLWRKKGYAIPPQWKNYLGIPLLIGDRLYGVLEIVNFSERRELDYYKSMLEEISEILAAALRNTIIYEDITVKAATLAVINKISNVINSSLNLQDVYSTFAQELKRLIAFDRVSLALLDETGEQFYVYALEPAQDTKLGPNVKLPRRGSAPGWVYEHKKPIVVGDLRAEKRFVEDEILLEEGYRSALRFPLMVKGKCIGSINLNSRRLNAFGPEAVSALEQIVGHVAIAVTNARLFEDVQAKSKLLEERNRRLMALNSISALLNQTLDLSRELSKVLQKVMEVTEREAGCIYQFKNDRELYRAAYYGNIPEDWLGKKKFYRVEEFPVGEAVRSEKILTIYGEQVEELAQFKSVGVVPLRTKNKIIGVMVIAGKGNRQFNQEELEFLEAIGNQIGVAMENAELYKELKRRAEYDDLTGLLNRRQFFYLLEREINRVQRYGGDLSLIMLDVDKFKQFNDTYGHLAGDRVLQKVASCIKNTIRQTDIAARYGGEEFAVIVIEANQEEAVNIAERIRRTVEALNQEERFVTVSLGVIGYKVDRDDLESLIQGADKALYQAKALGRNRVVAFSD
ncbi:diguanylate cyclase [Calderihabitans maritimus]|uniref:PAS/PAC sensor-containing diguanylate cyclase n=1 Tax=Calderihabitans maritimus TaxID=1246530 RepID=A0A1Z5HRS8_9FIRM|nr:diguanylate cyclase [Calderihabitans maritimus]GAW92229.1 PAS/PAC sensor-containing diguanylate cyclase [Calderihabitans maritimus]